MSKFALTLLVVWNPEPVTTSPALAVAARRRLAAGVGIPEVHGWIGVSSIAGVGAETGAAGLWFVPAGFTSTPL